MTANRRLPRLSPQLALERLPGARKSLPARASVLSVASLGAAVWGALTSPAVLSGYDALSWLLILIPAFLFAYYRGWQGATRVLAGGTLLVLLLELAAEHVLGLGVDWTFLFLVAVLLLGMGAGLGVLSEFLQRERREALALAYSDPLTGLPNRHLLDLILAQRFDDALEDNPLTLVLFGIDGFRSFNARYGRRAGDAVLNQVAECLDKNLPQIDIGGRFDGDQFLAILSGEKVEGAAIFAERMRELIRHLRLPNGTRIRVSVGVALFETWMRDPAQLTDCAQRALQRAKRRGGNCTVCEVGPEAAANSRHSAAAIDSDWPAEPAPERAAVLEEGSSGWIVEVEEGKEKFAIRDDPDGYAPIDDSTALEIDLEAELAAWEVAADYILGGGRPEATGAGPDDVESGLSGSIRH